MDKLESRRIFSGKKLLVEKNERAVEEISDNMPVGFPCQKRAFLGIFVENSLLIDIITLFCILSGQCSFTIVFCQDMKVILVFSSLIFFQFSSNHKSEHSLNHTTGLRIYRLQKEMGSHLMSSFLVYFVMDILYFVSFTTLHLVSRSMSLFLAHIFEITPDVWFRVLICT